MSTAPTLSLAPTKELLLLMQRLGQVKEFEQLMTTLDARCTGMAIWAHGIPEEPYKTWASGRVQELAELLKMYHQRNELMKMFNGEMPTTFTTGGVE